MSEPERVESTQAAARSVEVSITSRSRREAVPVLVVIGPAGEPMGAAPAGDATLAA